MEITTPWPYLLLAGVQLTQVGVALVATLLYRKAYFEMKRSPMILSVLLLLISICVGSAFNLAVTIQTISYGVMPSTLNNPFVMLVPRLLVTAALLYFIYASLHPNEEKPEKIR